MFYSLYSRLKNEGLGLVFSLFFPYLFVCQVLPLAIPSRAKPSLNGDGDGEGVHCLASNPNSLRSFKGNRDDALTRPRHHPSRFALASSFCNFRVQGKSPMSDVEKIPTSRLPLPYLVDLGNKRASSCSSNRLSVDAIDIVHLSGSFF
jgi:hypothetical protein